MPFGWAAAASAIGTIYSANESSKAADRATAAQQSAAEKSQRLADEQWADAKAYEEEASNFGSIANQNKAATRAAADVTSSFAGLRERLTKTPGINVNSQAYLNTVANTSLAEAAQKAAAETGARDKVVQTSEAKRTDAMSLGRGLAANAQSGLARTADMYGGIAAREQGSSTAGWGAVGGMLGSKQFQDWAGKTWSGATAQPAAQPTGSFGPTLDNAFAKGWD